MSGNENSGKKPIDPALKLIGIKSSLPRSERDKLLAKAASLGLSEASMIRVILIREVNK